MLMQPKLGGILPNFQLIRRTPTGESVASSMSTSPENEMLISTSPITLSRSPTSDAALNCNKHSVLNCTSRVVSKKEYAKIVHEQRDIFLRTHFDDVLSHIASRLRSDAMSMKPCKIEASFNIPTHFDRMKMEMVICDYFRYLDYDVIVEDSLVDVIRITIQ